jgi:lysozyme
MDLDSSLSTADTFIANAESFSSTPYWDVNGYAIGYGNHYYEDGSAVSADDDPIDETRGMQILSFYVDQNATAILAQVTAPLNENQLAALTSLRYNCGTITTTLLNLINSGADPSTVAAQIEITCTTSGGVSNPALIARRQAEAGLYQAVSLLPAGADTSVLLLAGVGIALLLLMSK